MKENCADRIKKALDLRNMKPVDLAEKSGIKKSALSQYMSNKISPRQNALYSLAKALDVSPAWLMGFDVPMENEETNYQVKTAARDKKVFDKYSKLDEAKRKIVEALIDSYFDENVEDEED
ncbi:hypothetical protein RN96_05305 [Fusobacterium polymorphum]|uniref:HTH cro/C1-type domain-containing protein n=1 Tax=Fusobacterium nucleatum subsp. polymorphum TaxID=76857 RepID=A0A2B7YNI4_FUSNP|nr:helix-turn-helix domain-containing protein [Fusobacterium polymorphum]PGH22543.1 hypothetical protein RN96_05305 [Fusobacterium polymorphum]